VLATAKRTPVDEPYKPHLDGNLVPPAFVPIVPNEYGLPTTVHYERSMFPLRPGDLGDLVLDVQTALGWRGTTVAEDGFYGPELQAALLERGAAEVSETFFTDLLTAFPPLVEGVYGYGDEPL